VVGQDGCGQTGGVASCVTDSVWLIDLVFSVMGEVNFQLISVNPTGLSSGRGRACVCGNHRLEVADDLFILSANSASPVGPILGAGM